MKAYSSTLKITLSTIFLVVTVSFRPAWSIHRGGVGPCNSCHSMHNARDGSDQEERRSRSLLLASDPSSVCLNCHAGPGGENRSSVFSFDGSALTPGGDFYWLTRTFTWTGGSSSGDSHGHNIVAGDFNLGPDLTYTQAPGGTYRSIDLGCTSCHDPHGRAGGGTREGKLPVSVSGSYGEQPAAETSAGAYRLLGESGYGGGQAAEGYQFLYEAPIARQNPNRRFAESDESHVDYGSGMSEWCANCHENIFRAAHTGDSDFEHPSGPAGTLDRDVVDMYNTYVNTGELLAMESGSGSEADAYLQFVPFERGVSSAESLDPTSTAGPNTISRVMCLTCHRAHGSAFRAGGRWDFDAVLLIDSHPGPGDGGVSGNDVSNSYYGRDISTEFGEEQGQFCQKCHAIDEEYLTETGIVPLLEEGTEPALDSGFEAPPLSDPLLQPPLPTP